MKGKLSLIIFICMIFLSSCTRRFSNSSQITAQKSDVFIIVTIDYEKQFELKNIFKVELDGNALIFRYNNDMIVLSGEDGESIQEMFDFPTQLHVTYENYEKFKKYY